ncbi:hypothetical protein [Cupriavidus sp. AU9028]|uniref:hypothetical protein n=1 Tax=Cupriavidus sp. AU9028 TaxID=2871157 RepID=UPI001C943914|nr:hypothetical protein [Cupriavidus sp. AU9028]MBY4897338.1 hypothetical protein [Cupriavidus sp. AU9028]
MTVLRLISTEWQQLRIDVRSAAGGRAGAEAARLRRKLWRKELGMAVVLLGAAVMFVDAATRLSLPLG